MKRTIPEPLPMIDRNTIKLTPAELKKELYAICGDYPGEDLAFGPEGKCPYCTNVQYTGTRLCDKHLKASQKQLDEPVRGKRKQK